MLSRWCVWPSDECCGITHCLLGERCCHNECRLQGMCCDDSGMCSKPGEQCCGFGPVCLGSRRCCPNGTCGHFCPDGTCRECCQDLDCPLGPCCNNSCCGRGMRDVVPMVRVALIVELISFTKRR